MPSRSPSTNPQPGDLLLWKPYLVEVKARQQDRVDYVVTGPDGSRRESTQSVEEWSGWTNMARVRRRGLGEGECVILKSCASGKCSVCSSYLEKDVHSTDAGITCAACCPGLIHK